MGFGTLFFGYFLLINNVAYCGFSDPIAALVMLMGLYRLSSVNRYFKYSTYLATGFSVFSLFELVLSATELFFPTARILACLSYVSMARAAVIAVLTATLLTGIREVAKEVDLKALATRAARMSSVSLLAYSMLVLMDAPALLSRLPSPALAILTLAVVIGIPVVVIINLTVIHGAYMQICMPDEGAGKEEKESRFAFVNEYRRRRAEKDAEYLEYRREKAKKRNERTKK